MKMLRSCLLFICVYGHICLQFFLCSGVLVKFLSCTFLSDNMSQHFYSVDAAIGFIDNNLDETASFSAFIRVKTPHRKAKFWFDSQETMLESLMSL